MAEELLLGTAGCVCWLVVLVAVGVGLAFALFVYVVASVPARPPDFQITLYPLQRVWRLRGGRWHPDLVRRDR
jgi:hypothetical protein